MIDSIRRAEECGGSVGGAAARLLVPRSGVYKKEKQDEENSEKILPQSLNYDEFSLHETPLTVDSVYFFIHQKYFSSL